jgi:hypothetical protein
LAQGQDLKRLSPIIDASDVGGRAVSRPIGYGAMAKWV